MKLYLAEQKARELMDTHGLSEWKLLFDSAKRRFGVTRYKEKVIGLSAALVTLNEEQQVIDTILHEIAHAVVGPRTIKLTETQAALLTAFLESYIESGTRSIAEEQSVKELLEVIEDARLRA